MIKKTNYRDQVREYLLKKMRDGSIKIGNSISLVGLSRDLDLSVTPIREALSQLQYSNIVEAVPNRGFMIPDLNSEEAINLYELVANIEALAIQNSIYTSKQLSKLKKQQRIFEKQKTSLGRINADIDFHTILTSEYNNPRAHQILSDLKARIFFYELGFMSDVLFHNSSESMHNEIIVAIENNNLKQAAKITNDNWLQILEYINQIGLHNLLHKSQ